MNTELRLVHNISSSNKHGKSAKDYRFTDLVKNWSMAKQLTSRHVYELDALTTKHGMTN